MARLFATIHSDTNKVEKTITGSERIDFYIYHGSAKNSKKLVVIHVNWPKDVDKPIVKLTVVKESK